MTRTLTIAGAQMGPTQRADSRAHTVARLVALLEEAAARGAKLVVFPELAFTTFFPRWPMERDAPELLGSFEPTMPNPQVQPLFDRAKRARRRVLCRLCRADAGGPALQQRGHGRAGRDDPVQVPQDPPAGSDHVKPGQRYQQLEKMYFQYGDLGFRPCAARQAWGAPVLGMLSATTAAGRRAGACSACRGSSW
jgi:predicted amidohydrolase